jgi:DNA polymerase III sliding clamp (beta) subunit (PCNA family)
VRLALEKDRLEVSASSPEYGEARESVETRYGQETLHIGFNAEYLCAGQLRGARRRAPFERGIM